MLEDLRRSDADMFRGGDRAFFDSGSHEGAAGEVAGSAEHAAGALMDSHDRVLPEKRRGSA